MVYQKKEINEKNIFISNNYFSANLFSQSFEENLDIYCDYDGDGKSPDCDLYEQFANNNWVTKDWRGSIDQRLDMITCKCYKKDISKQMEIYEYLGRSYEKEGILDSAGIKTRC